MTDESVLMEIERLKLNGHGVYLSAHPMGGWNCRITTFEHNCRGGHDHETWCSGHCANSTAQDSPEAALEKAKELGGIQ